MPSEQAIQLKRPQWEVIAVRVGTGEVGSRVYAELYPDCSTAASSFSRLLRRHPEIKDRIAQVRSRAEDRAIDRVAMTRGDVQEALLDNIEHAKQFGKPVIDRKTGEVVEYERNHTSINQSLKIIADINGLSIKANKDRKRGEGDPGVERTPEQLMEDISRLYAKKNGKPLDDDARDTLGRIANAARAASVAGEPADQPAPALRPVSETG